ncbi:zinc protease PQQL-like isoform X1 [Macadamia integrifolia]|uniref:zinc protease PQQL-like isoform X1 n=1 Tax=Macadamia integrifolia TaxID=60698 RepID=UPI001C531BBE|nr:zinc protease PQQL-like isoform X1 [Macadamia integrifolia]
MDLLPAESRRLAQKHGFRSLKLVNVSMDDVLGEDPVGVDYGRLDNGLCYYVRSNSKPRMRAALALAIKAGSVLEEEDERGVAHIVEHLAFSATKKYTNHDIVKFLESNGAEFGACQNALTSADETIYELLIPVDKPLFNGTCCQSCCIFGGARISLSVFHKYFLLCIMVSSLNLLTDCSMLSVYQLDLKK